MIHLADALGLGSQWVSDSASTCMGTLVKSWLGVPQQASTHFPDRLGGNLPGLASFENSRIGESKVPRKTGG